MHIKQEIYACLPVDSLDMLVMYTTQKSKIHKIWMAGCTVVCTVTRLVQKLKNSLLDRTVSNKSARRFECRSTLVVNK